MLIYRYCSICVKTMRKFYFIFPILLINSILTFAQCDNLKQCRQIHQSAIRNPPLNSFFIPNDKIKEVIKNPLGDTLKIIATPFWFQNNADSITIYQFGYDTLRRLIHVKLKNGEGKTKYCRIADSDISWSEQEISYDKHNRVIGYKHFYDTFLSKEWKFLFDTNDYLLESVYFSSICHGRDTVINNHTYNLPCTFQFDTLEHRKYVYDNNYHSFEMFEEKVELKHNNRLIKHQNYFKIEFDSLGRIIEKSEFKYGFGKKIFLEYNKYGNIISIRYCDKDNRLTNINGYSEGYAMILNIYNRKGKKLKAKYYFDESGKLLSVSH